MHEDSLKQLEMCTVACLNNSHLPSDTHTFYCACQSAQAQKGGKKLLFFFSLLVLFPLFWAFVGQVTCLLPLTHLLRSLMVTYCIPEKGKPGRYSSLKRASVKGSRHAVRSHCARASPGQSRWKCYLQEAVHKDHSFL